ncbi:MAG: 4Fe-4S binding protein [Pseudomonadota bacterium]
MIDLEKFNELFHVPPAMRKYIKLVVEPREMELILALNGETLDPPEIARRLGLPVEEAAAFLARSYERHVTTKIVGGEKVGYVFDYVDETGREIRYAPAKFYDRLDPLTMNENWTDIPEDVRKEISEWWLTEYIAKVRPIVEKIKEDPEAYFQIKQKDFLLVEQALEQVEAAEFHVVVNCDCRSSELACNHMKEGCIRFDDGARYTVGRGLGRVLTKDECKKLVLETDRDGLMHIGALGWKEHGLFGFCNCCTCCCFPLRTAERLHSQKQYPRSHYLAVRDLEKCIHCGLCTKRCQFHAFFKGEDKLEIKGKLRTRVLFDPEKCYGCGLCASACPQGAIVMKKLEQG